MNIKIFPTCASRQILQNRASAAADARNDLWWYIGMPWELVDKYFSIIIALTDSLASSVPSYVKYVAM